MISSTQINEINELENLLKNNKQELHDIIDKRINGIIVRSKAQLVEHSEKKTATILLVLKRKNLKLNLLLNLVSITKKLHNKMKY